MRGSTTGDREPRMDEEPPGRAFARSELAAQERHALAHPDQAATAVRPR